MTRVLIVTDADGDYESRSIAPQIMAARDPRIECTHVALPPAGAVPQAMRRLTHLDRQREFDVLHAVGPSSLLSVLPTGCQPIIYSPPADEPVRGLSRLKWISLARRVIVACGTEATRCELISRGVRRESTRVVAIIPQIELPEPLAREAIGLTHEHKILLACGESTRRANHRLAAWGGVIMYFFDTSYRTVFWGRGPMADIMRRYTASLRRPGSSFFAEDAAGRDISWPSLASMADLVMLTSTKPAGLYAARVCQQLGVPIVAAPSEAAHELDEDNLAISDSPRARVLAQAIHNAIERGKLRRLPPREAQVNDTVERWIELYADAIVGRTERSAQPAALLLP